MNAMIPRYLFLPVLLILLGAAAPLVLSCFDWSMGSDAALLAWTCNCWYIAISLAATEAVIRALFVCPQDVEVVELKNRHLQLMVRNIMLGIILWVCHWAASLEGVNEAAGYLSMRLGATLFLLGVLVVWVAHKRMKAM